MGANSAPVLANLTPYVDEANSMFIDNIEAAQGSQVAGRSALKFRFIDDILSWDFEPPALEFMN